MNLKKYSAQRVEIYPVAGGSENATLTLFINRFNYGDNRVFDSRITQGGGSHLEHGFDDVPEFCHVDQRKLDDVVDGRQIDVALLDTQGWGHEVLRWLRNTIQDRRLSILTEFVPTWLSDLGENPIEILKEYESWGYKLSSPDVPKDGPLSPTEVMEFLVDSGTYFLNVSLDSAV